jgi:hypothetical protein
MAEAIACGTKRNHGRLRSILQVLGISTTTELHGDDCDIYERITDR